MKRTPQYRLPFFQGGDLYSAALDRERMIVIDNQLKDVSSIVGDGVLSGWHVCHSGVDEIEVAPGSGFINNILHKTLSIKRKTVLDDVTTFVYMQSQMLGGSGGLNLETESPASNLGIATFSDTTPPAVPTGFSAVAADFDLINLFWDANSETDFDHYEIFRSNISAFGPFTLIASPTTNGVSPSDPYQDVDLIENTTYYYEIVAVDKSGNASSAAATSTTTLPDVRKPGEANTLVLYPSNTTMSAIWNPSATAGVVYRLTRQGLNLDDSVDPLQTVVYDNITDLFFQFTGLNNGTRYRILLQSKSATGILSDGLTADGTPAGSGSPLDPLLAPVSVTPLANAVGLAWLASPSSTGSAIGQKKEYRIRVIRNGIESSPIKQIGLALAKTVVSYNDAAIVGEGPTHTLVDNTVYAFRITTLDTFGNESVGLVVKGSILDTTPPNDPRLLRLVPGDTTAEATWSHSSSIDVVAYIVNIDAGPDIEIGYLKSYSLTGLTNGVSVSIRVRSKDAAGNISSPGVTALTIPVEDTVAPVVPTGVRAIGEDSQVVLSWNMNVEPDFDHYVVQRSAVTQNLLAIPGKNLTVATESVKSVAIGSVTTAVSTSSFASDALINFSDLTGYVVVMTSGLASGQKATIVSFNPINGLMTFATAFTILPQEGDNFSVKYTHSSFGTITRNVGAFNEILDIEMLNGQTYAYSIQAVDQRGNESDFSAIILVSPNCGMNDLNSPLNLVAAYSLGTITLTWDQIVPTTDHPASDHTAFNIYRSTDQFSGFVLIDSVPSDVLTYADTNLLNGLTYYYVVTAVRDNAEILIDTGSIQPPNTVLLAIVKISTATPLGCEITAIQNEQRIVEHLSATIEDETRTRLLAHKHRTKPVNTVTITAESLLGLIDVADLSEFDFEGLDLSAATRKYYDDLIIDKDGKTITYDVRTTYAISPSSVVSGLPYVGDFLVLLNGEKAAVEFTVDPDRNIIIFPEALEQSDIVALDGTGFSYYVPAKIDLNYRGFDIAVDGSPAFPSVDEALQTLRFAEPLAGTSVVTVIIEPAVPDFGTQQGARQISLSPNIVLNDFSTENGTLYVSETGAFDTSDTFFVLVDSERTALPHAVDAVRKTITFDAEVDEGSVVALEILNREEVQGTLLNNHFGGIEASTFKSGIFLKPQLPRISHSGRIEERALPIFQTLTTDNKYVYQAETGIVGSATTPYSMYVLEDGTLLIGTSNGVMKASGFAAFTGEGDETEITIDYSSKPPPGLKFTSATPDTVVNAAKDAAKFSGRFNGSITIRMLISGSPQDIKDIQGPNMLFMDDGKILISGGAVFNDTFATYNEVADTWIYDPATQLMTQTGSLNRRRRDHAGCLLPNGNILICGGSTYHIVHLNLTTFTPDVEDNIRETTTEIYDIASNTWLPTGDMAISRDYHSCVLLNETEVLVAGGASGISSYNGIFKPPRLTPPTNESTCELYDLNLETWRSTAQLNRTRVGGEIRVDHGVAIIEKGGQEGRELYTRDPESWTFEGSQTEAQKNSANDTFGVNSIDGPVKQFMTDSLGLILLVSRNNVYASEDGEKYLKMKGLEAVGIVHRISQGSNGTLFAATDLGVYEITADIHDQLTWFQGGLIGQGTTETFDLQPYGTAMLAATEIGIFTTSDNGDTWSQIVELEDVFNLKAVGSILFATSIKDLYRSDDGVTWFKVTTLSFLDENSKLVPRTPLDLFFATANGLYATRDGVTFFLVDLAKNRHPAENNVQMAEVVGSDLIVGYDNQLISIGPEFETLILAEFVGIVPTVLVNDVEARNGFRYDIKRDQIVFERKRLVNDVVKATSNYAVYSVENGPWYRQRPNAAVLVYVNGVTQDDSGLSLDSRLGTISFTESLRKTDVVTVSIAGTTLKNAGEFFHNELEDKMEQEKGLPLSLGRDHTGNLLQLGISMEHNFLERGIERNQYYCSQSSLVDRSFTSFLQNAEFYIMGRREFDRFNSTIDYAPESEQEFIGTRSLLPLSALEVTANLWVGTENGIFVLDPTAPIPFSVSQTIQIDDANPVRDMKFFQGDVWLVTKNGVYIQTSPSVFEKNDGNGLPSTLLIFNSINNVAILGTEDAIYYSDGANQDVPYSIWFRAAFVESQTIQPYFATGACRAMTIGEGIAYAGINNSIFLSSDGKTWTHIFDFDDKDISITSMNLFAKKLYVGTNKGLYSDEATARSDSPAFTLQRIEATLAESDDVTINDIFVFNDGTVTSMYAVGSTENVYRLANEVWGRTAIPGSIAIQKFIIMTGPKQVALANDSVYVQ